MALKKAGELPEIVTLDKKGAKLDAYFIKTKSIRSDKFQNGESTIHEFMLKNGKRVSIWGHGMLDKALEEVAQNPKCRTVITYKGKIDHTYAGEKVKMHDFDVQYDADDLMPTL